MSRYRPCSKCPGVMVLEDQGEFLEALDVMSLFEYRCRACGHLEGSEKGTLHVETKNRLDDRETIPSRWSEWDSGFTRTPARNGSREPLRAETSLAE